MDIKSAKILLDLVLDGMMPSDAEFDEAVRQLRIEADASTELSRIYAQYERILDRIRKMVEGQTEFENVSVEQWHCKDGDVYAGGTRYVGGYPDGTEFHLVDLVAPGQYSRCCGMEHPRRKTS